MAMVNLSQAEIDEKNKLRASQGLVSTGTPLGVSQVPPPQSVSANENAMTAHRDTNVALGASVPTPPVINNNQTTTAAPIAKPALPPGGVEYGSPRQQWNHMSPETTGKGQIGGLSMEGSKESFQRLAMDGVAPAIPKTPLAMARVTNTPVMNRTGVDDPVFLTKETARAQGIGGWQSRRAMNENIANVYKEKLGSSTLHDVNEFKGNVDLTNTQATEAGHNQRLATRNAFEGEQSTAERAWKTGENTSLYANQGLLQDKKHTNELDQEKSKYGYLSELQKEKAAQDKSNLPGKGFKYTAPTATKTITKNNNTSEEGYIQHPGMILDEGTGQLTPDFSGWTEEAKQEYMKRMIDQNKPKGRSAL